MVKGSDAVPPLTGNQTDDDWLHEKTVDNDRQETDQIRAVCVSSLKFFNTQILQQQNFMPWIS